MDDNDGEYFFTLQCHFSHCGRSCVRQGRNACKQYPIDFKHACSSSGNRTLFKRKIGKSQQYAITIVNCSEAAWSLLKGKYSSFVEDENAIIIPNLAQSQSPTSSASIRCSYDLYLHCVYFVWYKIIRTIHKMIVDSQSASQRSSSRSPPIDPALIAQCRNISIHKRMELIKV